MEFLRKLKRRPAFDADLDQEMHFHLEERADELERGGLPRAAALQQARREFGSLTRAAEDTRAAWQFPWLEDLGKDLHYAARALRREPGFLAVAVLSLALGIGVNTAIFSLTMEALMNAPSARDAGTLASARLGGSSHIGLQQVQFLREANAFPGLAGLREDYDLNWRLGDETQRLFAVRGTDNLFQMAGIPVRLGRGLQPGDRDVAVVTHRFWQAKLAADPAIIGRSLILDGRPHTVIGLLPEDHRTLFGMGLAPDLYTVVQGEDTFLRLYLRLPTGISLPAARERLKALAASLDLAMPQRDSKYANDLHLGLLQGLERLTSEREVSLFFGMLMLVVTLLLGIACLNVSGLLLARASSREQEFAVRASLGAGRTRLLRQLLTESLLLAILGTVAGLLLNLLLTRLISQVTLDNLPVPVAFHISPDWRLLAYASALATASAVLVGLLPAWRASRVKAGEALKRAEHQVGGKLNLRRALVIAQVATSIIVLTTAVLFARNLLKSMSADPGFDLNQTLYVSLRVLPDRYPLAKDRNALEARAHAALTAVPGVVSAAATRLIPFNDDSTNGGPFHVDLSAEPKHFRRHVNRVGPGYFATLGVPVLAGREFQRDQEPSQEPRIVVNESFARQAFGAVSPLGHTIRDGREKFVIIGVVRDSKYAWLSDHQRPAYFESHTMSDPVVHFMVCAGVDPESLVRPLRRAMLDIDPPAAIEVKPMRRALGMALLPSRVGAFLLGLMGALGLALTGIGLFGLMSYSVTRRIREIGLRIALGANPSRIRQLVFTEGAWLVGIGLGLGLLASVFLTKPLANFLVEGLSNTDPLTYAAVVVLILATGSLACAIPARRALRIHPMEALRYE